MAEEKVTALSLTQFLLDNPQVDITEDVCVAERFKAAGFKFTISAMSGEQFSAYQKEATAIGRHKKVNFDSKRFNELVVINHTVNPNFKDADTIKKAGCQTPEQFLYRSLRAGEVVELANQISRLSGFDTDPEALVDEVKNS